MDGKTFTEILSTNFRGRDYLRTDHEDLMNLPAESRIIGFIPELFFEFLPSQLTVISGSRSLTDGHTRDGGENFETLAVHIGQSRR